MSSVVIPPRSVGRPCGQLPFKQQESEMSMNPSPLEAGDLFGKAIIVVSFESGFKSLRCFNSFFQSRRYN